MKCPKYDICGDPEACQQGVPCDKVREAAVIAKSFDRVDQAMENFPWFDYQKAAEDAYADLLAFIHINCNEQYIPLLDLINDYTRKTKQAVRVRTLGFD